MTNTITADASAELADFLARTTKTCSLGEMYQQLSTRDALIAACRIPVHLAVGDRVIYRRSVTRATSSSVTAILGHEDVEMIARAVDPFGTGYAEKYGHSVTLRLPEAVSEIDDLHTSSSIVPAEVADNQIVAVLLNVVAGHA
jgi:hypothetical protein